MIDHFQKFYSSELVNPPYPAYHEGDDLETYFINFYFKNKSLFDETEFVFLPVKWTAIYNHRREIVPDLQNELNKLSVSKKYFTVSQHDDAPAETLPPRILNFSAGGNVPNTIPIPLVCSPIKNICLPEKDIFCSFVGSVTPSIGGFCSIAHEIRMKMLEVLVDNANYVLKPKCWSPHVSEQRKDLFLSTTARSKFTLCPRGYGATSFRLYEAMQLQSVPVYIFKDEPFLPYKNKINWKDVCVFINYTDINALDNILKNISEQRRQEMIAYTSKIYATYFSMKSIPLNVLQILKESKI